MFIYKVSAFIKKDFLNQISYRLDFILGFVGIIIQLMVFYFISRLFGKETNIYLRDYGGEYLPFVIIGIAFGGQLANTLRDFSSNLRQEQLMGTLEMILATPTKLSTIIISMELWSLIYTSIVIFIYLLCGILFFGVNFTNANFFAALIIFILTIISFNGLGIISASFIMVFKKGDPISALIGILFGLFGGIYFPITIMPIGLQVISHFLPITYSLRALRHALLQGYSFKMLLPDISMLLLFCVILFPLSIQIFKYAVKRAKIEGSLAHY